MSSAPRLGMLDAARIALLHAFSPKQQWTLAGAMVGSTGLANVPGIRGRKAEMLRALPDDLATEEIVGEWAERGYEFVTYYASGFPRELWEIPDPPLHLFVRGELRLAADVRPRVAVVGSRAASAAGLRLARELGRDLAIGGAVVVSGLARGIDGAAHRGALGAGGDSIAVLGTGLDRVYPEEHAELAVDVARQGALVTEFAPGTPPLPLHFPRRNRILIGLADALVVVEGTDRSGARSSVDHALDQGKEVFAVPRDPLHEGSELPNRLLRQGATPLTSAIDVLQVLADPRRRRSVPGDGTSAREKSPDSECGTSPPDVSARLRELLGASPGRTLDELVDTSGCGSPREVSAVLTELELTGWARRDAGGRWRLLRTVQSPS